jgi:prepilin-type N-terminal cleavage/methylation domain-containing protein
MMGLRRRLQRGDTLVEVLICILIVSLILTGAYVTTNRSSLAVRDSQEHSEAMKLIQSQLEQIRQNASTPAQEVFGGAASTDFCMAANAVVQASDAKCKQGSDGSPASGQLVYRLKIVRSNCIVGANCRLFAVTATWDKIGGDGQAFEQISYRLHE